MERKHPARTHLITGTFAPREFQTGINFGKSRSPRQEIAMHYKERDSLRGNVKQDRTRASVLEKQLTKIDAQSPSKRIYVFRCNESGLYAFTADREGRMLPSQMYPQITWQFEHTLTLRLNGDSWRDQILRVTLDGVAERGFHLIHAALYGELLGFIARHSAETV